MPNQLEENLRIVQNNINYLKLMLEDNNSKKSRERINELIEYYQNKEKELLKQLEVL